MTPRSVSWRAILAVPIMMIVVLAIGLAASKPPVASNSGFLMQPQDGFVPIAGSAAIYLVPNDAGVPSVVRSNGTQFKLYDPSSSGGGGGGMSIGGTVTSGTAGSVLFVNTGPVLAQDNTKFFWDDSNLGLALGIGALTNNETLHVRRSAGSITAPGDSTNTVAIFDNPGSNSVNLYLNNAGAGAGQHDSNVNFAVNGTTDAQIGYNDSTTTAYFTGPVLYVASDGITVGLAGPTGSERLHVRRSSGTITNPSDTTNTVAIFDNPGLNAVNVQLNLHSTQSDSNLNFQQDGATKAQVHFDRSADKLSVNAQGSGSVNICAAGDTMAFFDVTPVAQQSTTGTTTGFTANASANAVYNESTWTGGTGTKAYTVSDIVLALKHYGLLATN